MEAKGVQAPRGPRRRRWPGHAVEDGESCEDSIAEMEESCPDIYDETLECLLEASNEDEMGGCMLVCAFASMDESGESGE